MHLLHSRFRVVVLALPALLAVVADANGSTDNAAGQEQPASPRPRGAKYPVLHAGGGLAFLSGEPEGYFSVDAGLLVGSSHRRLWGGGVSVDHLSGSWRLGPYAALAMSGDGVPWFLGLGAQFGVSGRGERGERVARMRIGLPLAVLALWVESQLEVTKPSDVRLIAGISLDLPMTALMAFFIANGGKM